jgi:hypothetical protein
MLLHEINLDQELSKLQTEIGTMINEEQKAIRKMEWRQFHDNMYWSRKSWRMEVMDEYMKVQARAINIAYGGELSMAESAEVMAEIGTRGATALRHFSLETDWHSLTSIMYFDIGAYSHIDRSPRNDSTTIIQTATRVYLVSEHFVLGSPLSMAEVRITKSITAECALLVHITLRSYKVIRKGNITCYFHGRKKSTFLLTGAALHLGEHDNCRNDCINIGFSGYTTMHKNLPQQPKLHPASLAQFYFDENMERVIAPSSTLNTAHQMSHDILAQDIQESQDMIEEMNNEVKPIATESYAGIFGALLSMGIGGGLLAICIKIRCKKTKNKRSNNEEMVQMNKSVEEGDGEV